MTGIKEKYGPAVLRLTALWALCESGLGGLMHALRIPFTGFFVGGFAVVMIGLIAFYSGRNTRYILQATLLVILVKFAASPHSPFPAYIAVAFQGCMGALLYRVIPGFTTASVFFGAIALMESAVQKFLVTTLIFGKSVWEALDLFFKGILKDFSLPADFSFSFWLIATYTGLYTLWGILLGLWISRLPARINRNSENILEQFNRYKAGEEASPAMPAGKKKKSRVTTILLFLAGICLVFLIAAPGGKEKAGYVIIRTIAALFLLFYVIQPLFSFLLGKLLNKNRRGQQVSHIMGMLPGLRNLVRPAYRMSAAGNKGFRKYPAFVLALIILSLHSEQDEQ